MSKLDRATAALRSGRRYVLDGEQYVFYSFGLRPLAHPQDWPNLADFAGALWPVTPSDDPSFLVEWSGGQITEWLGWSTRYRTTHLLHQTRHAEGTYVQPWYSCDGIACGMIDV